MAAAHALLTFADAFDLGVAFLQGHGREASAEVVRQSIQEAYDDVINAYDWPSLEGSWRIHLKTIQQTGTVSYDSATRLLTLVGSTWPTWAGDASVRIDGVWSEVEAVVSSTVLRLHETMNPGGDIDAGTSYELARRWYPLPAGFVNFTGPRGRNSWAYGQRISMTEMAGYHANCHTTGAIQYYAIGERPNVPGQLAIFIWPLADASEPLDFTYQRRPRELQYAGRDAADSTGTVTLVSGSSDISGTDTLFEPDMVGAMLRVSRNSMLPTGRYGLNRFSEQLQIRSYTSATSIGVTEAASSSLSGVKFVVTDPIEVASCAKNAFLRYVEWKLAIKRGLDKLVNGAFSVRSYQELAREAMLAAMAASSPVRSNPRSNCDCSWSGTVDLSAYTD